jgi:hypothetical protein
MSDATQIQGRLAAHQGPVEGGDGVLELSVSAVARMVNAAGDKGNGLRSTARTASSGTISSSSESIPAFQSGLKQV